MIREMLGIAEGILQDLHNDHSEVASLISSIKGSKDQQQRNTLFNEMKSKLLAHAHAEQEVFYRRLETSQNEEGRNFAREGAGEHRMVEQQLQQLSTGTDKLSEQWTGQLTRLEELVDHHVDEEESTGFSCARDEFTKDQLEAMAQDFQRRKQQLTANITSG
jgi:hemerythrin-like domain-containing protein